MLNYPKPYSDETLLSFFYRVAEGNLMSNFNWIFQCLERDFNLKITEHRVNWMKGKELEQAADFLGIGLEEARKLTVISVAEKLGVEITNESKSQMFLYSKTRFCPFCLKEDLYQRKTWINTHSIICIKHQVFLLGECLNCMNITNTKNIIQDYCENCNYKLSQSSSTVAKAGPLLSYQKTLNNILLQGSLDYKHPWINNSLTFIKALDFLALWIAKLIKPESLSISGLNIYFKGSVLERNHLKNYKTIQQSICLYKYAYDIINNWPTGFYDFLKSAEIDNDSKFVSFIKQGVPRLIDTDLWNISMELTNFIAKTRFFLTGKEYVRSDEIKNINDRFNGSIIHSGQIKTHKLIYKGVEFNIIDKSDLRKVLKKYEDNYTKGELMTYWGTSSVATFTILQSGLIKDSFSYDTGAATTWVIPKSSVLDLESKLTSKSKSILQHPISLHYAFKWVGPKRADILISGVLTDKIGLEYNDQLFSRSLLNKRECYYFIKDKIIKESSNSGFISIRDLIFILGVKQSDIHYWVNTSRFGILNFSSELMPIENFLAFYNEYITTFELAFILDLQIKQIIKRHSIGKLKSLSGPDQNDGKRLLFRREFL